MEANIQSETTLIPAEPVNLDAETQKRLLRQVLKGTINRSEFPELWPPEKKIRIFIGDEQI